MGEIRYSLELYFAGVYREIDLGMDSPQEFMVGTTKNCMYRLPAEMFFSDFQFSLVRNDNGDWKIFSSEENYLNVEGSVRLRSLELVHGGRFSIHYQNGGAQICTCEFIRNFNYGLNDYSRFIELDGVNSLDIGGSKDCRILIHDEAVGNDYISINRTVNDKIWQVTDHNTRYGLSVNGYRINGSCALYDYDFFSIAGHGFFLRGDRLYLCDDPQIQPVDIRLLEHNNSKSAMVYPHLNRSTRIYYQIPPEEIEYIDPPEKAKPRRQSLLMTIMPSLAMLFVLVFVRGFLMNTSGGSGKFVIFSACSMSISLITSIVNYKNQKKYAKEDEEKRVAAYTAYAQKKEEEIIEKRREEVLLMEANTPAMNETLKTVWDFDGRLYERTPRDEDFLSVRLGTGEVDSVSQVKYSKKERLMIEDEMVTWPETIAEKYKKLPQAPIMLPLRQLTMIGIVGQEDVVYENLKSMIIDLCVRHSFQDLQIGLMCPEKDISRWEWIRWLRHINNENTGMRNIAYDDNSYKVFAEYMYKELVERENSCGDSSTKAPVFERNFVIFITEPFELMSHPLSRFFYTDVNYGFTFIFCRSAEELLPSCQRLIRLGTSPIELIDTHDAANVTHYSGFGVTDSQAKRVASKLACVTVDEVSLEAQLTKSITLFKLLGIFNVEDLDLKKRWEESQVYKSMAVPMGVDAKNDIVYLDLHEKAHGPHGLVAGTTGSGKSETLQTYILSLTTLFHPYEVGFVIIDFKGGGMVNQFRDLPHLVGSITDIDGREIDRSLLSIHAELNKRKELFALANVNQIDLYIKKYRAGEVKTPLPHLLLIVDEFAELKADQPEFMKELISTARIGRSLGIHLILATQKPSGVVDAQIWSNSRFRLCLKVATPEDSKEMLKTPLAAEIREPGRAYLQVGNDEIFLLFQSAYSGGPADSEMVIGNKDYEINKVAVNGAKEQIYVSKQEKKQKESLTQLQTIVQYVHDYCEKAGIKRLPGICLPSLSTVIRTDELDYSNYNDDISVPIGIYDDPELQVQEPVDIAVSKDNVYIVGSSQMGKTVLLQTMIYGLLRRYTSEQINFYLVDCGSMVLKVFEAAPHVGGVVLSNDNEKCKNLFKLLFAMVDERKKILSERGVGNFAAYLEAGYKDMPLTMVMIDNMAAFKEYFPDQAEAMAALSREAIGVGISIVVTAAAANALSYKIQANFGIKLVLNCNDPNEYANLFGHCRMTPRENPGRGIIMLEKRLLEWQSAIFGKSDKEAERSQELLTFLESLKGTPARPIPIIPENPEWKTYSQLDEVIAMAKTTDYLPFGYDQETADVYGINLKSTYTYLISGKSRTGKTNALKVLACSAKMMGAELAIFDFTNELKSLAGQLDALYINNYRGISEYFEKLMPEFIERNKVKKACIEEGVTEDVMYERMRPFSKKILLVANLIDFVKELKKKEEGVKDVSGFIGNVLDKGARHNVYWIAGLNQDNAAEVIADKTYTLYIREKVGAYFGGNVQEQRLMQFPNLNFAAMNKKLKPGHAFLSAHEGDETDAVVVPLHS